MIRDGHGNCIACMRVPGQSANPASRVHICRRLWCAGLCALAADRAATDQSQLRCFRLHLDLSATQARMVYVDRAPTIVEFRSERSAFPFRRGLVVRSLPYTGTAFGPGAVWHPIEQRGIAFDWGTGFAGFTVAFARSGSGYLGTARTYVDIEGVPVESFAASLEPVVCDHDAAEPRVGADRAQAEHRWTGSSVASLPLISMGRTSRRSADRR